MKLLFGVRLCTILVLMTIFGTYWRTNRQERCDGVLVSAVAFYTPTQVQDPAYCLNKAPIDSPETLQWVKSLRHHIIRFKGTLRKSKVMCLTYYQSLKLINHYGANYSGEREYHFSLREHDPCAPWIYQLVQKLCNVQFRWVLNVPLGFKT